MQLAQRLTDATVKRKLTWKVLSPNPVPAERGREPRSAGATAFETTLPAATVQVASVDGDGVSPYRISLIKDGAVIESLQTEYFGEDEYGQAAPWNQAIEDLYRAARSQALGIDATIDALFSDVTALVVDARRRHTVLSLVSSRITLLLPQCYT